MSAAVDAALDYAGRGWPVLPLWWPQDGPKRCPCRDPECGVTDAAGKLKGTPAKHPHGGLVPNGNDDATTDQDTIRRWWEQCPELNVGLRTGVAFDVLDIDNPDAAGWLAHYAHEHGASTPDCWGWAPMAITGKGHHLLYLPTGAGNRAKMGGAVGLDWRGAGGYIVAPPSRHVSGVTYQWHPDCGPDVPLVPAPAFLTALARNETQPPPRPPRRDGRPSLGIPPAGGGRWNPAGIIGTMATAAEGERNNTLTWCAARIGEDVAAGKANNADTAQALDDLHTVAVRAGLTDHEVGRTIRSGFELGRTGQRKRERGAA